MAVPQLTATQSRRRVARLRRAGCKVETRTLPSGDRVVLKKCPPGVRGNPHPLAGAGDWQPASGGTERPFTTRTGRRLQYVWQPRTGAHAYYDVDRDVVLSDDEAMRALGTFDNQVPAPNALGYLVLAGFGAALLYAIFRPRRVAAASATPPATTCSLETTQDFARLESWAVAKNIGVVYLPATTTPPQPATSELARGIASSAANLVVVTGDGTFWTYTSGEPVLAPSDQADFCNFKPPATVSGIVWL